jgi:hypothetical protein
MKVLLRDTQTGQFYAGAEKWTDDHSEALDFEETNLALDAVSDSKLRRIEVLMHFEDPAFEIPLKVIHPPA